MPKIHSIGRLSPKFGKDIFLAPGCQVIGDVNISDHASIWFNCVVRGDVDQIDIGESSNIQDLSMLHVTKGFPLLIGKEVTVGHSCILHGSKIGDNTLIGMGAILMDGSEIGNKSLVAAGSLVSPGKIFPDKSLIMGRPAKLIRKLSQDEINTYSQHFLKYIENKNDYLQNMNPINEY